MSYITSSARTFTCMDETTKGKALSMISKADCLIFFAIRTFMNLNSLKFLIRDFKGTRDNSIESGS